MTGYLSCGQFTRKYYDKIGSELIISPRWIALTSAGEVGEEKLAILLYGVHIFYIQMNNL